MSFKTDGVRQFRGRLDKVAEILDIPLEKAAKTMSFDIFNSLIRSSPRDTGHFQSSWQYTVDEISTAVAPPPDGERSEGAATQMALTTRDKNQSKVGPFSLIMMTNALPYAKRLDEGHSKIQAPAGITKPVMAAHSKRVNLAYAEFKRQMRRQLAKSK